MPLVQLHLTTYYVVEVHCFFGCILNFLVSFGVQLLMYATPIIYPLSSIPEKYKWLIYANPMSGIVEAFRFGALGEGCFSWPMLSYSFVFMVVLLFVAIYCASSRNKTLVPCISRIGTLPFGELFGVSIISMPCSRQERRQISAISPSPSITTWEWPALRISIKCSETR